MATELVYNGLYGPAKGQKEPIELVPVFRRGNYLKAWAALDRAGREIGILLCPAPVPRRWRLSVPFERTTGVTLARCRLTPGLTEAQQTLGMKKGHTVTDLRNTSREVYIPFSTCDITAFNALRSKIRAAQADFTPGQTVSWDRLLVALKLGSRTHYTTDDIVCALRAEGWRPVNRVGWTYDRFPALRRSRTARRR